jgi:hypothetical protein
MQSQHAMLRLMKSKLPATQVALIGNDCTRTMRHGECTSAASGRFIKRFQSLRVHFFRFKKKSFSDPFPLERKVVGSMANAGSSSAGLVSER